MTIINHVGSLVIRTVIRNRDVPRFRRLLKLVRSNRNLEMKSTERVVREAIWHYLDHLEKRASPECTVQR